MSHQTGLGRPLADWRYGMIKRSFFHNFNTSPETVRVAMMMSVRSPLWPRNVEGWLHERGIEISGETVRFW